LSFGAQSAVPAELALLGREHQFEAVARAVRHSREAGFENLSLDLIYGLPGQGLGSWAVSLRAALDLEPDHISLYCLTIEPGTPLQRSLRQGLIPLPDPDVAADQYALACETLAGRGFQHYEISNWARPGRQCLHNLAYWRNAEYLGFGAGAHGHAAGRRYSVVRQPRAYIRRLSAGRPGRYPCSAAVAEHHLLTRQEAMADAVITRLRLLDEGLSLSQFAAEHGQTIFHAFPGTAEQLLDWGLLEQRDGRLFLAERGWFLSNQVFYRFV
jgi:oxygen-independent coproporphyrinogen-3 oxidase